ncbi:hypothetical protein [Nitrosomonas ureae]|uniref:Sulfate adenylyltransferase subunit 2 n=1 Tax=Nitrosomonas ureae TaxID=44577 RepID=A0A1H9CJS6_9PROT|nr:hypothetical protein [Nitrosomonas ureae]PTQ88707.1 hypothetical protein C8R28_100199 [Nitrosomonas ureae]PXX18338.1 hypothetical protein C8R27_10158 [Nitrosomonas ureae]SDU15210.1 sulfate adenylyltransferase subunit 2 [Nitrosomonas ureae]SEQ01414.1 sulfate adenylyltransferase subunit 2 [Nitrosomonas ureae]
MSRRAFTHLDTLESGAIHIMREVAAEYVNPMLLFFGDDSYCFIALS